MPFPDEFHALAKAVNNWGRWGNDDERGTLNLITDAVVRRGAAAVRSGKRFALALPLGADGPQMGNIPGRFNPIHTMTSIHDPAPYGDPDWRTSDDIAVIALQGATHWDALAHVSYEGRLYNGFPLDSVTTKGAAKLGIDKIGAVVSRGVLLDVARARGVDRLEGAHAVTPEDLDAAEDLAKVRVEEGDIILIRTGQIRALKSGDKMGYVFPTAGIGMAATRWFHERGVAAAATDTLGFEVIPPERQDCWLPVHLLDLVEMGLTQGQNWDLEALSADCADDGQYDFLLHATPEPFVGGVGAPVAPVAVK